MKRLTTMIVAAVLHVAAFAQQPDSTFTVNIIANPDFGGTTTGAGVYLYGETVSVSAAANSGYQFLNWTINGIVADTNSTYSFVITSDITLYANFRQGGSTYTITTAVYPENAGATFGQGIYSEGETVYLSASENANFVFSSWMVNGIIVSFDPDYVFVAESNIHLVANFTSTTSNEEPGDDLSLKVYPNPSSGPVNFILEDEYQVAVFNASGKLIHTANTVTGLNQIELQSSGAYFLQFTNKAGTIINRQVIIQK